MHTDTENTQNSVYTMEEMHTNHYTDMNSTTTAHTQTQKNTHAQKKAQTNTQSQIYIIDTHTHIHTHTRTHTHTHTCSQTIAYHTRSLRDSFEFSVCACLVTKPSFPLVP